MKERRTGDALLLGSDLGTSSTKTVLMSETGHLLAEAVQEYPMHRPHPDWAENDPDDWLRAVLDTVRRVIAAAGADPARIRGWSLVSQRDPVVLLDEGGRVLTPSISWVDRRTLDLNRELFEIFGYTRLVDLTGVRPIGGLTLHNLVWTMRHRPDVWGQVRHILFAKDYVLYRLTGQIGTDSSTPSRSVMNDVRAGGWSHRICDRMGIDVSLLPEIRWHPWQQLDELSATAAAATGLRPGIPIAAGGGDDQSATLGAGVISPGDICAGTGTASCWRSVTDVCRPEPQGRADLSPHVVPDRYVLEMTIASTGSSLRWLRDTFAQDALAEEARTGKSAYDSLVEAAAQVPPGADGLLYYPYLEGARTPRYNDDGSGVFFGLRASHTRAHFVRAVLEGVAFQYPATLALLASQGMGGGRFSLVDGETRSPLWNQIKADVLGRPVHVPRVIQSAAVGAVILAGMAAGVFRDAQEGVEAVVHWDRVYEPDPLRQARYRELGDRYERVYPMLDEAFHRAGAAPAAPAPAREPIIVGGSR
ncbi:MAG TPA: FGGY family carbohydrate kinase [Candidatus Limnocylindrales bacterium]|nr:FGGY family carbohydrate kinase [Candidatus Limnocylindrales bacterium]